MLPDPAVACCAADCSVEFDDEEPDDVLACDVPDVPGVLVVLVATVAPVDARPRPATMPTDPSTPARAAVVVTLLTRDLARSRLAIACSSLLITLSSDPPGPSGSARLKPIAVP